MKETQIFIVGDSTVQNYQEKDSPQAGWGQYMETFFTSQVSIQNKAIGGRSSRSFIQEGRLSSIEEKIQEGDFLFIQFGHNDADDTKPERYVVVEQFAFWLSKYIQLAKGAKAIPILFSPVAIKKFNQEGICEISFPAYREEMEKISQKEKVLYIDLGKKTAMYFTQLGEKECEKLFMKDAVHFRNEGAKVIANLVIQGIREKETSLKKYLKKS